MFRVLRTLPVVLLVLAAAHAVRASELDAVALSLNVRQFHMPYGTLLDPVFASGDPEAPEYSQIVGYTRAGDSAIWTGHYLAAEAFRYRMTHAPDALDNVQRALIGIRGLLDITGNDVLARFLMPADSPYATTIQQEEGGHGIYYTPVGDGTYMWIGDTSRDQYAGVMFGLGVAYDLVDDQAVRDFIRQDVTRILTYLLDHQWSVVMPDGRWSTTFVTRPDQQLSFLQVGRRVDPARFEAAYVSARQKTASLVGLPILYDNFDDHAHYFKFNLNYITFYNLIRLEESTSPFRATYVRAYDALRRRTEAHGNAHFNMIDRALKGANADRDAATVTLLEEWLKRPRRDYWVDLRATYPACGSDDRACSPVPAAERPNTDFLWQRSPFLLYGGATGTIETAAIDYILSYWMARCYEVLQ